MLVFILEIAALNLFNNSVLGHVAHTCIAISQKSGHFKFKNAFFQTQKNAP